MTSEYDEPTEHSFFDLQFKCTNSAANEILLRMSEVSQYRSWDVADNMLRFGRWDPTSAEFKDLCERVSNLRITVRRQVAKILAEVLR